MDLAFTPEEQKFATEVRAFVKANLPADVRDKVKNGKHLGRDDYMRWQQPDRGSFRRGAKQVYVRSGLRHAVEFGRQRRHGAPLLGLAARHAAIKIEGRAVVEARDIDVEMPGE